MSINRFNPQRDKNEKEIVEALKKVGASVARTNFLDLVVGYKGVNYIIEVKMPKGKLSAGQELIIETWQGRKPEVVYSIQDAFRAIGIEQWQS